ncbi:MAG: sensor histidine kinase [Spirochaetota bacterium]
MIREVHHRVKNNLQLVQSMFAIQSMKTGNPETRELLAAAEQRIRGIAEVYNLLLQGDSVGFARMDRYLETLVSSVDASLDRTIDFAVDVDTLRLNIDQAVPCGLIANELITNSVKHAVRDHRGARIGVGLHEVGENTA